MDMKSSFKAFTLLIILLLLSIPVLQAKIWVDEHRPPDVSDRKWSSLKAVVKQAKLLPIPAEVGGEGSVFGKSVFIEGDRALVGGPETAGSGAVYVYDFDGVSWQESAILVPLDGFPEDNFGISLSLSGNMALIGAYKDDDNGFFEVGSAYVFEFDGLNWSQSEKLMASDGAPNDFFGYSVSLSGNRALIGSYRDSDSGNRSGSAYIFDFDGKNWNQNAKLVANDADSGDYFGYSVSLSGNRALIGSKNDDGVVGTTGSAFIFDFNGDAWVQSAKLFGDDGEYEDYFGHSVSLFGNRALIGAYGDDGIHTDIGSAYEFKFDGLVWAQTVKLLPEDGESYEGFGYSVSISGDRAAVGAIGNNSSLESTSVYIFDFDGANWVQESKLVAADGDIRFAQSVSLSGDRVMVGAYGDASAGYNSGAAFMYGFDGLNWSETQKLTARAGAPNAYFGMSLSMSGDRVLIGAANDKNNAGLKVGAAYIYDFNDENWSLTTKLLAEDVVEHDRFGVSVSLSGDRALIGAIDNGFGVYSGSAYVYDYDGISWTQSAKLVAEDADEYGFFGSSVSLSGDRILIGSYGNGEFGDSSGAAYVFDFDNLNWSQTDKLTPFGIESGDLFGYSVSVLGNRVLVGSRDDDINGDIRAGSAYIFDYDDGFWNQSAKLTANDGNNFFQFGSSVSLSHDRALVGAPSAFGADFDSGAAYVFQFNGFSWNQSAKLIAGDGSEYDLFGNSVSLSDDRALVGAEGISSGIGFIDRGAAYLYDFNGTDWIQSKKMIADDGAYRDNFGSSVSLFDNQALIGAPLDDDRGLNSGSAYVIDVTDLIYRNGFDE